MNKNKIALTLGIVCTILTIAIVIQINTINKTNSISQGFAEDSLRDEYLRLKEKTDNLSRQVEERGKELDRIREQVTEGDGEYSGIEDEINLNNNLLGTTELVGQGVEIVVQDDPTATRDTISVFDNISDHIVHDADLRVLVNELKNAGAEAISINGQRLVNTTAITCIGNVIKINDEKITSPFTIKAIGLSEMLAGIDRPGGYVERLRDYGIVVTIKKSSEVSIPKYNGIISSKYMTIPR